MESQKLATTPTLIPALERRQRRVHSLSQEPGPAGEARLGNNRAHLPGTPAWQVFRAGGFRTKRFQKGGCSPHCVGLAAYRESVVKGHPAVWGSQRGSVPMPRLWDNSRPVERGAAGMAMLAEGPSKPQGQGRGAGSLAQPDLLSTARRQPSSLPPLSLNIPPPRL